MKKPTVSGTATGHEEVSQSTRLCKEKNGGLLSPSLEEEKETRRAVGKKRESTTAFCRHQQFQSHIRCSSRTLSMGKLSSFKGFCLIIGLCHPHAVDDAHPHVGQSTDRHAVSLAFSTFALVVGSRPRFTQGRLPG